MQRMTGKTLRAKVGKHEDSVYIPRRLAYDVVPFDNHPELL